MSNKKFNAALMPIIFAAVLSSGILLGMLLQENSSTDLKFDTSYNKLNYILSYINSEYVDSISENELIEKSLPKIFESLDPHSSYIPAKELAQVNESLEGNFEGIGVQFNIQQDTIVVVYVISGGPSEKIGILPGDRIIKINDTIVAGTKISNDNVIKKLKGPKGTSVKVGISRNKSNSLNDYTITRDKIPLYSIDIAYMIAEKTGYIKLSKFATTTYQEFKKATMRLKKQGMTKMILDLRGNGGGFLDAATKIADELLENKKIIVYTEGKSRPKTITYATERGSFEKEEIIVLIDEWSASASEIIAGAIQDNDRGTILGRRSFGKGLVQEQVPLPDGSALRLTVARYYTPTGRCIQKPYSDNPENYADEITHRFLHGEFVKQDSIKFPDSLKYKTPKGKIVYGGGGIMPDIFIPVDTIGWSPYMTTVSNKGLIYQFAFKYVDENRTLLKKYTNTEQLNEFLDKIHLVNQFIVFASNKGVARNYQQIKESEFVLKTQLKAYIARNIFDNEGFYPIIKDIDNTLIKAIEICK